MLKTTCFLASAAFVAAQTGTSNQPCAVAAAALRQASIIPAVTAFNCLDSVPVDTSGNSKLIDQLKVVWQFQSELIWLKNPGSDWEYGPLDLIGELDKIKGSLGSYKSEYQVQLAIQNLTIRTGNFHFNYAPDILQVFSFGRVFDVASISSDGKSLPKLYVEPDVAAVAKGRSSVSDITQLNGQNAYDYLVQSSWSQYIDSDGKIQSMFAKGDTGNVGAFSNQAKYDGNATQVTWSNGTTVSVQNVATTPLRSSFTSITDGQSFFNAFCTGRLTGQQADSAEAEKGVVSPGILGPVPTIPRGNAYLKKRQNIPTDYANAVVQSSSGVVSGFFLSGNGYSDIAVLKIISFSNPKSSGETAFNNDFQATIAKFLQQCISNNKKKLIIDLRENGGGNTNLLLDAFMQLFPSMEPFSGQRYRATDYFDKIGNAVNEIYTNSKLHPAYTTFTNDDITQSDFYRYWAWWHFRTAAGNNFNGWDEYNGPLKLNGDSFTTTNRYNYSNADNVSIRPDGFYFVNGTRQQAFDPSNTIMFTDALCGSSCASFHEELKNIAGVKAVTVGGRPQNKPIQTVTGSKGGEVVPLNTFPKTANVTLQVAGSVKLKSVKSNDASLNALANVPQLLTRVGSDSSRAQSQDQIRKGDKTATPLQYVYEAADCRIFYTANTYSDPVAAWKQAWDAYQDNSKCVQGSTNDKSSISGGYKPYGPGQLKDADQPASSSGKSAANGMKTGSLAVAIAAAVFATLF